MMMIGRHKHRINTLLEKNKKIIYGKIRKIYILV